MAWAWCFPCKHQIDMTTFYPNNMRQKKRAMNTHKVMQVVLGFHLQMFVPPMLPNILSTMNYLVHKLGWLQTYDTIARMNVSNQLFRSDGDPNPNHASVCPLSGCVSPEKLSENHISLHPDVNANYMGADGDQKTPNHALLCTQIWQCLKHSDPCRVPDMGVET